VRSARPTGHLSGAQRLTTTRTRRRQSRPPHGLPRPGTLRSTQATTRQIKNERVDPASALRLRISPWEYLARRTVWRRGHDLHPSRRESERLLRPPVWRPFSAWLLAHVTILCILCQDRRLLSRSPGVWQNIGSFARRCIAVQDPGVSAQNSEPLAAEGDHDHNRGSLRLPRSNAPGAYSSEVAPSFAGRYTR